MTYLQRLAARATGHTVASSLRPIVRSSMSGESDADPFASTVESHELPVAQAPQAASTEHATSNDARVTDSHAPVASAPRSRRHKRSHAEETPQPTVETQPPSPESEGANRQSVKMDYRASPKEEPRKRTNETPGRTKPATTQTALLEEKNQMPGKDEFRKRSEAPLREQVLAPRTRIDHPPKPFAKVSETGDEVHADRSKRMAGDVSQQVGPTEDTVRSGQSFARLIRMDPPSESTPILEPRRVDVARTAVKVPGSREESSATLEPRRADTRRIESQSPGLTGLKEEPAATLEPRAAAVPPAAPIPDEPRLVIGQLRVDVVAAAPAPPREVVRVVTRNGGPGRSSNTGSSLSKLRFGLGQM
jgi:hypothetical protein